MLQVTDLAGKLSLDVLEILDKANTNYLGHPVPTTVSSKPVNGKCILVSGHDLMCLRKLLEQTEGKGVNVYTHGEMLNSHSYPEFKKYKHLVGHFGTAWQRQGIDFKHFPGAILMTSNCLIEPRKSYKDRIFTTGPVGWTGIKTVNPNDYTNLIAKAKECEGFNDNNHESSSIKHKEYLTGFGHNAVLGVADKVIDAIKAGHVKDIFVIGGCDGSEGTRS